MALVPAFLSVLAYMSSLVTGAWLSLWVQLFCLFKLLAALLSWIGGAALQIQPHRNFPCFISPWSLSELPRLLTQGMTEWIIRVCINGPKRWSWKRYPGWGEGSIVLMRCWPHSARASKLGADMVREYVHSSKIWCWEGLMVCRFWMLPRVKGTGLKKG